MQKLKSVEHLIPIKFIKHRNKKNIILKLVENQNISRIVLCFLTHRALPRLDERKN